MSWGAVAALRRPRIKRNRSACRGRIPAFDPVSKDLASPLCRKPRITQAQCNLLGYALQLPNDCGPYAQRAR